MASGPDPSLPFAFVGDLDDPVLARDEHHHLERVRRLRAGDHLTVGDGAGRFRVVRFGPALQVVGAIDAVPAPSPAITIAFALTKRDRPDTVCRQLTEIGVDRLVPFVADRSITRWDADKAARNVARWRVIAGEAAAQAHRPHLPEIAAVARFVDLAGSAEPPCLAHLDGEPIDSTCTFILVGPEGGWSSDELASGFRRVRLGPHVLRAETAAVVAGALAVAGRSHPSG